MEREIACAHDQRRRPKINGVLSNPIRQGQKTRRFDRQTEPSMEPKRDDDSGRPSEREPDRQERPKDRKNDGEDELPPPEKYPPVVEYDD
jgi:hypothetical protein